MHHIETKKNNDLALTGMQPRMLGVGYVFGTVKRQNSIICYFDFRVIVIICGNVESEIYYF